MLAVTVFLWRDVIGKRVLFFKLIKSAPFQTIQYIYIYVCVCVCVCVRERVCVFEFSQNYCLPIPNFSLPMLSRAPYWINISKHEYISTSIRLSYLNNHYRCPWCNGYRRRIRTRRHEFKSWTWLIAFHIALILLGKVWIQIFSLQLWVK